MTTTILAASALPRLDRHAAARIAQAELDASVAFYQSLTPEQWDAPTACPSWRIREMVAHLIGAMEESVRFPVLIRHARQGRKRYPRLSQLDGLNEVQIDDRRDWAPAQLLDGLREWGPKAVKARRNLPALLRKVRVPSPEGGKMTLAYLNDVLYPRDMWMHRLDAARATGREFTVAEHDRQLVAQVVRDLALDWDGPAIDLTLTGGAGGRWLLGEGAPSEPVTFDAVEFCLVLSGREGRPLPEGATRTPAIERLLSVRVLF